MGVLEELLKKHCPDGVEYKKLISVCDIKRGERITKKDITENGIFPIISGGQFPMGMYDKFNRDENTITIASYGSAGYVDYQTKKFWANDVCLCVYPKINLLNKFLYYYLKFKQDFLYSKTTNAIPNHIPTDIIKELLIAVPPIEVQKEIVGILDEFTEKTNKLQELLHRETILRKKQYEYYREKLLTFGEDVELKKLADVSEIKRGIRVVKSQLSNNYKYPVYQNSLTPLGFYKNSNVDCNTSFIITAGAAGEIGYSENSFWAADDCFYFKSSNIILNKYIYYFLLSKKHYLYSQVRRASIPRLSRNTIENLKIPVPPLEEQERIVNILDKFDALCNDITRGLPAEIELRKKQYEYYRDKLLTFKEKK